MRFFVLITKDNKQRLQDLLNSTGQGVVHEGQFPVEDVGKDPIGDFDRKIQDGYTGSANFEGADRKLLN
jgi:hypothetical protein